MTGRTVATILASESANYCKEHTRTKRERNGGEVHEKNAEPNNAREKANVER